MSRVSIAVGTAMIALYLAACSSSGTAVPSPPLRSNAVPTPRSTSAPTTSKATVIELPRLSRKGIVVQWSTEGGSGIDLLAMNGRRIARLRGFHIANPLSSPGAVILTRSRSDFRLFVAAHELRETRYNVRNREPRIGAPFPRSSGSWLWTARSPDGLLGEWREQISECSLPVALIEEPSGWRVLASPASPVHAPMSIGLGWVSDGRPVVAVQGGPCNGVTQPRTGVYVVTPNAMERILTSAGSYAFRMWGSR